MRWAEPPTDPPEPEYDCECTSWWCDSCDNEDCECVGHIEDCSICWTKRGCRCDDLYEASRERRYER